MLFRAQVLARPWSDWIVVDEVQRVPRLLDEVHFLMEEHGYRRFAVDVVWWHGREMTAIEVKAGRRYRSEYRAGIRSLEAGFKGRLRSWIGGAEKLHVDGTHVLPLDTFFERLHRGDILGEGACMVTTLTTDNVTLIWKPAHEGLPASPTAR